MIMESINNIGINIQDYFCNANPDFIVYSLIVIMGIATFLIIKNVRF